MKRMLLAAGLSACLPAALLAGDIKKISSGQKVNVSRHLVSGKYTVVEFTAPW